MRNKVNRLEEIFMRLVERRGAAGDGARGEPARRAARARRGGRRRERRRRCRRPARGIRRCAGSASSTIVIREYGRIIRIWGQTIVPSAVTATLYFVIFGSLIGRRVGVMGGFDYMQYIAPGLIMMSVITNSYGNVVSSFFGAKFGKHVEELLVSPLPNWVIVAGYVTGGVVRGVLVGGSGDRRVAGVHAPARASPLADRERAVLLTSLDLLARRLPQRAVRQELRPGQLDPDVRAHAAHLLRRRVLFGAACCRTGRSTLSYVNPILYMVNAFRYGFLGVSDVDVGVAFALMVGRGGGAVRRRGRPHEPRDRNAGVSSAVALVSARAARGLDDDMPPLLAAFAAAGAHGRDR